jgi:hypothetical protein
MEPGGMLLDMYFLLSGWVGYSYVWDDLLLDLLRERDELHKHSEVDLIHVNGQLPRGRYPSTHTEVSSSAMLIVC